MDAGSQALIRLSGALATGDEGLIETHLRTAATECAPDEVEEALLQSHLFLGYPTALGALGIWRGVSGRAASLSQDETEQNFQQRGEEICRRVYGNQYESLRKNVADLHPSVDRWMITDGYGRVLGRPGLPLATRELCIVAQLAVLHAPVQLYSHLRGALAVGATPEEVEGALRQAEEFLSPDASNTAWECWERVSARSR